MLAEGSPLVEYEDHALPAGTCTEQSLAGVLGCELEVSIPAGCPVPFHEDFEVRGNNTTGSRGSSSEEMAPSLLVLKLRQVNGEGVMSGVGGDVWCAALLLSAWLLQAPEVVEGLAVLELGSGLGLCGIVAGYLAESVTLTDYVDELVVNLQHNIEINRLPRVNKALGPPSTAGGARTDGTAAVRGTEKEPRGGQRHHDHHYHHHRQQRRAGGGGRELASLRRISRSRVRTCKLDWTEYEHAGTRNGRCPDDARRGGDNMGGGWWWDDTGKPMGDDYKGGAAAPLSPDAGPASAVLRCDVMIGSALIYSPQHACVADVLSVAFEEGGCRAAHIVQLSTRPGFDDFLRRLRSCGLHYRLQRMSRVLPAELLEEIRRNTQVAVVGGPVLGRDDGSGDGAKIGGAEVGRGDGKARGDVPAGIVTPVAGFDEFVLCSVFRDYGETT
eukprot:g19919.t1